MPSVLLLTARPEFHARWTAACERSGFAVQSHATHEFSHLLCEGIGVVVDGGDRTCRTGELLARAALIKMHGAIPAVALSDRAHSNAFTDLLMELCGGLVAPNDDAIPPVVAALQHRCERRQGSHFAYLGPAPEHQGLLAVLLDGRCALISRPLNGTDDGSPIVHVELRDDCQLAHVWLSNGKRLRIVASDVAPSPVNLPPPPSTSLTIGPTLGDVDGTRLGQRLRSLRIAAGLTQAELSRRTGIHRPNIARAESGRHTPSLETLSRLATAIGISTTQILSD